MAVGLVLQTSVCFQTVLIVGGQQWTALLNHAAICICLKSEAINSFIKLDINFAIIYSVPGTHQVHRSVLERMNKKRIQTCVLTGMPWPSLWLIGFVIPGTVICNVNLEPSGAPEQEAPGGMRQLPDLFYLFRCCCHCVFASLLGFSFFSVCYSSRKLTFLLPYFPLEQLMQADVIINKELCK